MEIFEANLSSTSEASGSGLQETMPAQLSFIDRLDDRPSSAFNSSAPAPQTMEDLLTGVFQSDNQYFDTDGDQIMFSAGTLPVDNTLSQQEELRRQMAGLANITNSQFGHFSEELVDDSEETDISS